LTTALSTLDDIRLINLQTISDDTGKLVVMENGESLNMTIKRVFFVLDHKDVLRGRHAHIECSQILICQSGICDVICDDGKQKKTFTIDNPSQGLFIPASIWSEQFYQAEKTLLLVLCDQLYNEADYIRNYKNFKVYRESGLKGN
jgi:dTDP-4-dehydrorhamnose 3,5-epimerase-like enzyme